MSQPRIPVAVFISNLDVGGTERQMVELAARLDRATFRTQVACFSATGPLRARLDEAGIPVAAFPISGGFYRPASCRQMWRFSRWCRAERIQVLQTTDFYSNIFALPAAMAARVPVRLGSRRELKTLKSGAQLFLQRIAYQAAHVVVANCRAAADRLVRERLAPSRVRRIPNGIELNAFRPRAITGVRRVITIANLRPEKRHDVLIDAARAVCAQRPEIEFLIVGDGPLRAAVQERIRAAGMEGRIRLLGHRDDVPAVLSSADVFVLPSQSEAMPNAVIEAMASGIPVVASAVGGLLEMIEPSRTGLLVPIGDSDALAGAILRLAADPDLAARIGSAARAAAADRYSFARMVAEFERLYQDLLARRGIGVAPRLEPARL